MKASKLFIVACEASGDIHGAHLAGSIKKLIPSVQFQGIGGPEMKAAGVHLHEDMTKISSLGFGDVIRQYGKYLKIFNHTIAEIKAWRPDAVIVIDSPAFNLRLAKKISSQFPVIYYISPQIWAWGMRRIKVIKKHIAKMLVILPFEEELYKREKMDCSFTGHPLLDHLKVSGPREELRAKIGLAASDTAVALLAGSREKEVRRIFPVMLESARLLHKKMPGLRFFYLRRHNVGDDFYDGLLSSYSDLPISSPEMNFHDLTYSADFALVTSGTATLETALLGTPFFLLYRTSWSTYFLGKRLIRVPYLGLVNLLLDKRVVPEFIQDLAKPETIAHEAEVLLKNQELYQGMKREFAELRKILGSQGASDRAAESVLEFLKRHDTLDKHEVETGRN